MKVLLIATQVLALVALTAAYNPTQPYSVPVAYEANIEFKIPYIGFTEPVYVYADANKSKLRLDYFAGMDTYIFDNTVNATDYTIVPVDNEMTCLSTVSSGPSGMTIWPDLSKFSLVDTTKVIYTDAFPGGVKCNAWFYSYGQVAPDKSNNGSASSMLPDDEGYSGNYTFYVSAADGTPVQFYLQGHNVVLGGSHSDVYVVNYLSIKPQKEIDDIIFQPPSGMPCHPSDNPFGPTYKFGDNGNSLPKGMVRSNPLEDFHMLFPEGAALREQKFLGYLKAHSKYYTSFEERKMRKFLFQQNLRYINAANRLGRLYHLAPNHLADWTEEEKLSMMGLAKKPELKDDILGVCGLYTKSTSTPKESVDWRQTCPAGSSSSCSSLVLPPKDQGTCGSCWTFGTTGAIEAAWAKKTGDLVPLSQQNIMDCTWKYGVQGCNGGTDYIAYAWLMNENGGQIASEASYGNYMNHDGFCHYDLSTNPPNNKNPWTGKTVTTGATMASCTHVTKQWNCTDSCVDSQTAVDTLTDALSEGNVLSVAIDATNPDFYYYHSGYYYSDKCLSGNDDLDHQVLAVGYLNGPDGERYTIIRNSWSDHWGEGGYVKISQKNNCCGVGTQPTFVDA